MRYEGLPFKLTTGDDFQSYGNVSEKKNADCTAGKSYVHGFGVDSPTFHGEFVSSNRKSTENNFFAKMEGNLEGHIQINHTSKNSGKQKDVKSPYYLARPFKCNECDYSATRAATLKRHVQAKHTFEKPFKCNECDYSATTATNLKRHVQAKHTFEKPFKCNECDYSTMHTTTLKRHVQAKHTFEKPFKCNECDYSATQASYLKRHVQGKHTF